MDTTKYCLSLGIVSFVSLLSVVVTAQTLQAAEAEIESQSQGAASNAEQILPLGTESSPTSPDVSQSETVCPPGQFASAFSDVPPDHWAYTAVNRLASVPIQCFDFVENQ